MRRSDRLFDIIQNLRVAHRPKTAAELAAELEVAPRTIYRDVATLQARRVPIEGEPGVGYVLRRGFDLPPLMFTIEEVEAIAVGARLLRRTGDPSLMAAAEHVLSKLAVILPEPLRSNLAAAPFFVSGPGAPVAANADLTKVRTGIREHRKLEIGYCDERGVQTQRRIWPIALAYYVQATLIGAWCELRSDYRHFRADRIMSLRILDEHYPPDDGRMMRAWLALHQPAGAAQGE